MALSLLVLLNVTMTSAFATAELETTTQLDEVLALQQQPADPVQMLAARDDNQLAMASPGSSPFDSTAQNGVYSPIMNVVARYVASHNRKLPADEVMQISQAIVYSSAQYRVDYRLLCSLIAVESSFRRDAISSAGAIGMGQLKPDTAKWLGVMDPFDPVDNIAGTARFLAWLVQKYKGNLESALSAYFQGPGFVDRNGVTDICMPYLVKINNALIGLI